MKWSEENLMMIWGVEWMKHAFSTRLAYVLFLTLSLIIQLFIFFLYEYKLPSWVFSFYVRLLPYFFFRSFQKKAWVIGKAGRERRGRRKRGESERKGKGREGEKKERGEWEEGEGKGRRVRKGGEESESWHAILKFFLLKGWKNRGKKWNEIDQRPRYCLFLFLL